MEDKTAEAKNYQHIKRNYFEGLSCAETASRLHISLEMVKYYLFKTRKILKEGISMEREFGTKSYQPAKLWKTAPIPS